MPNPIDLNGLYTAPMWTEAEQKARFVFRPFSFEVRPDSSEAVFLDQWQTLMLAKAEAHEKIEPGAVEADMWFIENENSRFPIVEMLGGCPSDLATQVATSLVFWTGTHIGRNRLLEHPLVKKADEIEKLCYGFRQNAYFHAWNDLNVDNFYRARVLGVDRLEKVPSRAIRVMERVMLWYGSAHGQEFLKNCQTALDRRDALSAAQRQTSLDSRRMSGSLSRGPETV